MPLHDCEGISPTGTCTADDSVIVCSPYEGPVIAYPCAPGGCVDDDESGGAHCSYPDDEYEEELGESGDLTSG